MSGTTDDALGEVARDLSKGKTAEQFVVLLVGHLREVTYTDFDKPGTDINVPTLKRKFGNPEKFTEEQLRDAIAYNEGRRRLVVHRFPVPNSERAGSNGKSYSQMTRVRVTCRL